MSESGQVIAFETAQKQPDFAAVRDRLTRILIKHALVDSYARFNEANKPYPFIPPEHLVPGVAARSAERSFQNTALVFAIDGKLPVVLNKHFRLRASNRAAWRNIQRLAPDLDLSEYKADDNRFDAPGFDDLLTKLLPLDYALLIEQDAEPSTGFLLSHVHVKVERLTDNAIKELSRKLGYIDRRLFERGEDYVDALEGKYYEYYGFSWNASGRKSAAAMAAQLFSDEALAFAVFVASQEENRLTVLDQSDTVSQYLLICPVGDELSALRATLNAAGVTDLAPYLVSGAAATGPVLVLRILLERTEAARAAKRHRRDKDVLAPWLELSAEHLMPLADLSAPEIAYAWSRLARERDSSA